MKKNTLNSKIAEYSEPCPKRPNLPRNKKIQYSFKLSVFGTYNFCKFQVDDADEDGSGSINFQEFVSLMLKRQEGGLTKEEIKEVSE